MKEIDDSLQKLRKLKQDLEHQMDEFQKEIYEVKDHNFGISNTVKSMLAHMVRHGGGVEAVFGEAYNLAQHKQFKDANEYVEYLKNTISHAHDYRSKVDQVIANLEEAKRNIEYQMNDARTWLAKSAEMTKS